MLNLARGETQSLREPLSPEGYLVIFPLLSSAPLSLLTLTNTQGFQKMLSQFTHCDIMMNIYSVSSGPLSWLTASETQPSVEFLFVCFGS